MNSKITIGIIVGVAIAIGIGVVMTFEDGFSNIENTELEEKIEFTDTAEEIIEPETEPNETQGKSITIRLNETMAMEGK